jgi:hypothetical protein
MDFSGLSRVQRERVLKNLGSSSHSSHGGDGEVDGAVCLKGPLDKGDDSTDKMDKMH